MYCKDGEPGYLTKQASTLPDRKNNAVIIDGVYQAIYMRHTGYQALQLRTYEDMYNWNIPAERYDGDTDNPDSAYAIDLHTGKDISEGSSWSAGCLTVHETEYYQFGVEADFLTKLDNGIWPDSYEEVKVELPMEPIIKPEQIKKWGYIVVDRRFMTEEERSVFFSGNQE